MYTKEPWTLNEQVNQVKSKRKSIKSKSKPYYKVKKHNYNTKKKRKKTITFKFFKWTISIKN